MSNIIKVKLRDFSSFVHSTFRNESPKSILPSEVAKICGTLSHAHSGVRCWLIYVFIDIECLFEHIVSLIGFGGEYS